MRRPKTAFFDLSGCEGCQLQVVNTADLLPVITDRIDLVEFCEAISEQWDGTYDVSFMEGSVHYEHAVTRLKRIRERSTILVALGSCAVIGGVNGPKNAFDPGGSRSLRLRRRARLFHHGRNTAPPPSGLGGVRRAWLSDLNPRAVHRAQVHPPWNQLPRTGRSGLHRVQAQRERLHIQPRRDLPRAGDARRLQLLVREQRHRTRAANSGFRWTYFHRFDGPTPELRDFG